MTEKRDKIWELKQWYQIIVKTDCIRVFHHSYQREDECEVSLFNHPHLHPSWGTCKTGYVSLGVWWNNKCQDGSYNCDQNSSLFILICITHVPKMGFWPLYYCFHFDFLTLALAEAPQAFQWILLFKNRKINNTSEAHLPYLSNV